MAVHKPVYAYPSLTDYITCTLNEDNKLLPGSHEVPKDIHYSTFTVDIV